MGLSFEGDYVIRWPTLVETATDDDDDDDDDDLSSMKSQLPSLVYHSINFT
jgi:hypothetical protein